MVSRRQLLALEFTTDAIRERVEEMGRLHPVFAGVYAVGRPELGREGRWMAAVLACGEGAFLSHSSAAALWRIGGEWGRGTEVTVLRRPAPRRPGIHAVARPSLPAADITIERHIPVTTPARTILDLATRLDPSAVERLVNEADNHDHLDPESLRAYLNARSAPGVRDLRRLLDEETFRLSDSELERRVRSIAVAAGLAVPLTKQWVNEFEVDFYWPQLGLILEADSFRYHRTAAKQARDLLRDQTHVAAGLRVLRISHWQIRYEPARVRSLLTTVLGGSPAAASPS